MSHYSVIAGLSAASAGVFGKMAFDDQVVSGFFQSHPEILNFFLGQSSTFESYLILIIRALCFVMVFVSNALMWTLFTKSMNLSNSVTATVINSGVNYFSSAVFGLLLFGETLSLKWWAGSSLILLGLFIMINYSSSNTTKEQKETNKTKEIKEITKEEKKAKSTPKSIDNDDPQIEEQEPIKSTPTQSTTTTTKKRSKKD